MSEIKTNGVCVICGESIAKRSALKHIDSCFLANNDMKSNGNRAFVIRVTDDGPGVFWIYFSVPATSTLEEVDQYIRDLWLECCGHLSMFEMRGERYYAYPDPDYGDKSMKVRLSKVFEPGITAKYEYDFGTTTELLFEVVREYNAKTKHDIKLLMRNEMPEVGCQACGKEATLICSYCQLLSCKKCKKKDECGDENSFLPFVNSPRTGQCGFTG